MKNCTDIPQSKILATILPLESADMRIGNYVGKSGKVDGTNVHYYTKGESFGAPEIIYAWSLAALSEFILPYIADDDGNNYKFYLSKDGLDRWVAYYKSDDVSIHICEESDNMIDVILEMVCWLKKEEYI